MNNRCGVRRKPIYGIGINDVDYVTSTKVNGKHVTCPFYRAWHNMMKRCYDRNCHAKQPTYKGCSVATEWHRFSAFRSWMNRQDWKGKELDKDILIPGNKVYSPDACMFVTRQINSLIHVRKSEPWPQGVSIDVYADKFRAEFTSYGKKRYIGLFHNPNKAGEAYRQAKAAHIKDVAMQQEPRLRDALLRHSEAMSC